MQIFLRKEANMKNKIFIRAFIIIACCFLSFIAFSGGIGGCSGGGEEGSSPSEGVSTEIICGDGVCSEGEIDCPADCPLISDSRDGVVDGDDVVEPSCGNTRCEAGETPVLCPADCSAVCGDALCTHDETALTCEADCDPICGDRSCTRGETPLACPDECPAVCGDGICTRGEDAALCAEDCPASCGDHICTEGTETAAICPGDCPPLAPVVLRSTARDSGIEFTFRPKPDDGAARYLICKSTIAERVRNCGSPDADYPLGTILNSGRAEYAYTDVLVTNATTYYYSIASQNDSGLSISTLFPPLTPQFGTGFSIADVAVTPLPDESRALIIRWRKSCHPELAGFKIYRSSNLTLTPEQIAIPANQVTFVPKVIGAECISRAPDPKYIDHGLSLGTTYRYVVRAANGEEADARQTDIGPTSFAQATAPFYTSDVTSLPPTIGALAGDRFGQAVAIDGKHAVVGIPYHHFFTDSGRATFYTQNDVGEWIATQIDNPGPAPKNNDLFGYAVAIDQNFMVIGAPYDDGNNSETQNNSGAVYLYQIDTATPTMIRRIQPDTTANSECGKSVSISNYASGANNYYFIIIGCPGFNDGRGEAYVIEGQPIIGSYSWGDPSRLFILGLADGDRFGSSVTISGQYAAIGIPNDDIDLNADGTREDRVGQVVIFKRTSRETWTELGDERMHGSAASAEFGYALDMYNDRLVIGSPCNQTIYMMTRDASDHFTQEDSEHMTLSLFNGFGKSIGIHDNFIIVGVPGYHSGHLDQQGSVMLYRRSGPVDNPWQVYTLLVEPVPVVDGHFGYSVNIGDNGYMIIGVDRASDVGAAYIY